MAEDEHTIKHGRIVMISGAGPNDSPLFFDHGEGWSVIRADLARRVQQRIDEAERNYLEGRSRFATGPRIIAYEGKLYGLAGFDPLAPHKPTTEPQPEPSD